jgi:ATP-dependent helicase IRC3
MATYQSLLSAGRLDKYDPNMLKAIIVDEAHHAAAPSYVLCNVARPHAHYRHSYRKLLSRFHSAIKAPKPDTPELVETVPAQPTPVIGFSATFSRHDGLALGSVFERIVYHHDFVAMIKAQWFVKLGTRCLHARNSITYAGSVRSALQP